MTRREYLKEIHKVLVSLYTSDSDANLLDRYDTMLAYVGILYRIDAITMEERNILFSDCRSIRSK